MFEQYYRILQIPFGSDEETIKKAYRQKALKIHPDINDSPDANEKFHELCEAYEILLSHSSRLQEMDLSAEPSVEFNYNWEDAIREAQEKARARARVRYEKIKAEQELFEKGEWRDVLVFLKYLWSIIALTGGIWLFVWPIYYVFKEGFELVFAMLFFWAAGLFLLSHIYKNRKTWFRHGRLNLSYQTIKKYFDFSEYANVTANCAYCRDHKGNGKPFKFSMLKVRGVKIQNAGPMQHYVHYKRTYKELYIPRSRKAFYIHFSLSFIKPLIILAGILFIPFPGIIWRFFMAFFVALIVGGIIALATRTQPKTSFLLTPFIILKISVWIIVMMSQTHVYPGLIPVSNDILVLLTGLMLIFLDMFLDLMLRAFPFYVWFYRPLIKQLPGIEYLFKKGYQPFLDIPVWSTLYPFFRWMF